MTKDMKMVIESLQEIKADLNSVKAEVAELKAQKVSTAKTSAKQKSSTTTTKSSKKTSTKQTKVDPKDFAPKSLTSYKSVKTARAKFAQAVTGKQWVDRDVFLKAVKPFDDTFGTWVAGKGLCK